MPIRKLGSLAYMLADRAIVERARFGLKGSWLAILVVSTLKD